MSQFASHAENLTSFIDAMRSHGIVTSDPIEADGKLHRIHVEGDAKGKRNGWYILHIDETPFGLFGCKKRFGDEKLKWSGQSAAPLSREERERLSREAAARKAKRVAEEAERWKRAQVRAGSLWDAAREAPHPYLKRKGIDGFGARVGDWIKENKDGSTRTIKNALLIPLRYGKDIVSLQAIFAEKVSIGESQRDREYLYGGRKEGCWYPIGKPTEIAGRPTVLLGEGFATCASAHMATGLAAIVAFDAGNLIHVAKELVRRRPDLRIVILADNDQFTTVSGVPRNPGVEQAKLAAQAVGADVVVPQFVDLTEEPTDFNDLHACEGLEEVRRQIMAIVDPPQEGPGEAEEPPPWDEVPDYGDGPGAPPEAPDGGKPKKPTPPPADDEPDLPDDNGWFTVLGHDGRHVYIYQSEMKMVYSRAFSDIQGALLAIAPLPWWENQWVRQGVTKWKEPAANWILRLAYERGYYNPNSVRGRGAWRDEGRMVLHCGDKLIVDGVAMDMADIRSNFVYEQGPRLRPPSETPASREDGQLVIDVAKMFHWTRPASAVLLAGWVALAPLCGALRWRPHIWLTGGTGSGKTTVLNEFIWPLMNGMELYAQGNSTEAGIRGALQRDALPVLFDESEQNNEREVGRIQAVLALMRQSSSESGAKTLKGTQIGGVLGFMIRSMFCLSSVQVGIKQQADIERLTVLALRPKRDSVDPAQAWAILSEGLSKLKADPDLPARLLRRSLDLLPVTVQNIEVFARAAAEKFGSQREGDQYGAMLAGAWSLVREAPATMDQARAMIDRYEWEEYLEGSETEESAKALGALMSALVRTTKGDVSVYELVMRAIGYERTDSADSDFAFTGSQKEAEAILRRHGMMTKPIDGVPHLLVANTHMELERLLERTPYAADVKGQLLRVDGAQRHGTERFGGVSSRSVAIPVRVITDDQSLTARAAEDLDFNF